MNEITETTAKPAPRRFDLDWLRIGAFGLLILYHVAMFYVPWDWHVKSPHILPWLTVPMELLNPWRLPLLFLVSGAATRFMADKMSPVKLARLRTVRLLVPLVFGVMVIVPPQSYLQVVERFGFRGGFVDFYRLYIEGYRGFCTADGCLILPTWNHLWFVAYLLVYTLVLIPVWAAARPVMGPLQRLGERCLAGWGLLAWPAVGAVLVQIFLEPRFPETHMLVGDWTLHAVSVAPFLFGFLFGKSEAVSETFVRLRWPALLLALGGYVGMIALQTAHRHSTGEAVAYGVDQWSFISAALGFARRHLADRDGPARRYLTEAIFPFYIIHQTTIVVAAYSLAKLGLPVAIEAALLVMITALSCWATFEIVRRVAWLRPLFGLKARAAWRPSAERHAPLSRKPLQTMYDDMT